MKPSEIAAELNTLKKQPRRSLLLLLLTAALVGAASLAYTFASKFVEKKAEAVAVAGATAASMVIPASASSSPARPGGGSDGPSAAVGLGTLAGDPSAPPAVAASTLNMHFTGKVHGATNGPLVPGMRLRSGDHIALSVTTSVPANVYLLYCDTAGTLSLFPPAGSIATAAMTTVSLPGRGQEFTLDHHPGRDVFYVVASRSALSQSDPALEKALANARPAAGGPECGGQLEEALAGPVRPAHASTTTAAPTRGPALRGFEITNTGPSGPDPGLNVASGPDGIAVLRIAIDHMDH
jgi:hypothetical protein